VYKINPTFWWLDPALLKKKNFFLRVNVYHKDLTLFKSFPFINSVIEYVGLSPSSAGKYVYKGTL
jgi:hypothetical protein